jgi:EF hand/EF-hand domain pair
MSNSKILPIAFIVASLVGGSAMIATAQEAPATPSATTETATPATTPSLLTRIKAKFGGERGFGKGGEMLQNLMTEVDTDKSGSITQDEINAFRAAKVAAADTSKDGALSLDEFAVAYNEMMRSKMVDAFQNFDDDGNGSITTAELDARFGDVVAKMDKNGDGVLSKADRPDHGGKGGKGHGKKRGGDNRGDDGQNN